MNDKCKWKYKPDNLKSMCEVVINLGGFWQTGCNNRELTNNDQLVTDWKYCLYCGKEIEYYGKEIEVIE